MKGRFGVTLGDVCLMAVVFCAAILLFFLPFFGEAAERAEIEIVESGGVRKISLATDAVYAVESRGVHLTVSVENGKISVTEADCRDGVCKGTPPISRAGQSIVCAPAGVIVRVVGEGAVVDGVSG